MKYFFLFVLAAFLTIAHFEAPTHADDDSLSLLERLDRETARITKQADGALAHIKTVHGWQKGVLVGDGPFLVAGYSPELKGREAEFRLADGTRGKARRIEGDADLGVAVYTLPPAAAAGHTGLDVERGWTQRGRLAVFGGPHPGLSAVTKTDELAGRVRTATTAEAPIVLSASGRLLGLRPPVAMSQDCKACHVANDPAVLHTMPFVSGGELRIPHVFEWGQARLTPGQKLLSVPPPHGVTGWTWAHRPALSIPHHPPMEPAPAGTEYIAGPVIARVVDDIQKHGRIRRAYLGAVPSDTKKGAKEKGVVLSTVIQDSPVARAGVKKGDVITAVNGVAVENALAFTKTIVRARPGDILELSLAGKELRIRVELGDRRVAASRILRPRQVGFAGQTLDESLRLYLGMKPDAVGVVVTSVNGNSAAHAAGLRRGDVIVAGRDGAIRDLGELEAELAGAAREFALKVLRDKKERVIVLTLKGGENHPR